MVADVVIIWQQVNHGISLHIMVYQLYKLYRRNKEAAEIRAQANTAAEHTLQDLCY